MPQELFNEFTPDDIEAIRSISHTARDAQFHLHNSFEIYLFLQGEVNCFVEQSLYRLKRGTLLLFNNQEIHRSSNLSSKAYERIVINFNHQIIEKITTEHTNLLSCFLDRKKGQDNAILLSRKQLDVFLVFATKLIDTLQSNEYGSDLLALTYLIQILIYINKIYKQDEFQLEQYPLSEKLQDVLDYINTNITEDLNLARISDHFSLNKSYLGRLFKKETGSTIYNYILFRRISLSKQLLADGRNVFEACTLSGFNDYSNFIRTFKQNTGYSPAKYAKLHS
jgi:AraC-type DNA-binding domain-containing proteins